MDKRVVFVEDDAVIRENYVELLSDEGFCVEAFADHASALARVSEALPDLVLLDISLNDERDAGFQLCADLRRLSKKLPIVFFTSHDSERDKISGIRLGADDYLTKDVSVDYLVIRMEALLRRHAELAVAAAEDDAKRLVSGPLTIDLDRLNVTWNERPVDLSLTQLRITHELAAHPGQVKSFSRLMRAADLCVEPNTVTAHVRAIRNAFRSLEPGFDWIKSERGVGYRWLAA